MGVGKVQNHYGFGLFQHPLDHNIFTNEFLTDFTLCVQPLSAIFLQYESVFEYHWFFSKRRQKAFFDWTCPRYYTLLSYIRHILWFFQNPQIRVVNVFSSKLAVWISTFTFQMLHGSKYVSAFKFTIKLGQGVYLNPRKQLRSYLWPFWKNQQKHCGDFGHFLPISQCLQ